MLDDWGVRTDQVGKGVLSVERAATEEELAALARATEIEACTSFRCKYEVSPAAGGRYLVRGRLNASVVQACIISLAPLETKIEEAIEAEFVPPHMLGSGEEGEQEILGGVSVEVLEGDELGIGRLLFEIFSASLDPFPKTEGAEFDWSDHATQAEQQEGGPFAGLSKLRRST